MKQVSCLFTRVAFSGMLLRPFSRGLLNIRSYSESVPLGQIHATLKDVEGLIARHKLNEIKSIEKVQELVKSGTITEHMGNSLIHDIRVQQEAGSKSTFFSKKFNLVIETAEYWRKIFLFIGLPVIGIVGFNTYLLEKEHFEHLEEHPVNGVPYDYLKIRTKVHLIFTVLICVFFSQKYPWGDGDKTLFHNDKVNR